MINPTQMHRMPTDYEAPYKAADSVHIQLSDAEQAKLRDAVEWFLFHSTPDSDGNTDGMGYASPTPSDVTARDDVLRAERALLVRAALTDAAYWFGSALALAGAAALIWWPQ